MSIKEFNIQPIVRQVQYTLSITKPIIKPNEDDPYYSSGVIETINFDGTLDALKGYAGNIQGSKENRYQITINAHSDGEHGSMSVQKTVFVKKEDDEEEESGGEAGETEDSPSYTITHSTSQEPIMSHKLFAAGLKALPSDDVGLIALNMLVNGASRADRIPNVLVNGKRTTVGDAIDNGAQVVKDCAKKVMEGILYWLAPHTIATARWKVNGYRLPNYEAGTIANPKGGITTPQGKSWLVLGAGVERTGKGVNAEYIASVEFELGEWHLSGLYN